MPLPVRIFLAAPILLLMVLGLVILGKGAREVWRAVASSKWPKARGVVLALGAEQDLSRDRPAGATSDTRPAKITFGYEVGGKAYTTDTVHFGKRIGSGGSADAELDRLRYPVGAPVSICVHPRDPSIATLKPGIYAEVFWFAAIGLGLTLPCLMGLLFVLAAETNIRVSGLALGLFAMIFCLAGAAMLHRGLVRLWYAYSSQYWPVADGVIVYQRQGTSSSETRSRSGYSARYTFYHANLVFQYDAGGATHFATTRRFGELAGGSEEWANEIAQRYPQGAPVKVAYRPTDPDLAVLESGIDSDAYWLPGAGLAILLFGLAALIWGVPALSHDL